MSKPRIVSTDGTCGGHPRIEGHRFPVSSVILYIQGGMSPEDLVREFQLTLEEVAAATEYYESHKNHIDAIITAKDFYYDAISKLSHEEFNTPGALDAEDAEFERIISEGIEKDRQESIEARIQGLRERYEKDTRDQEFVRLIQSGSADSIFRSLEKDRFEVMDEWPGRPETLEKLCNVWGIDCPGINE